MPTTVLPSQTTKFATKTGSCNVNSFWVVGAVVLSSRDTNGWVVGAVVLSLGQTPMVQTKVAINSTLKPL